MFFRRRPHRGQTSGSTFHTCLIRAAQRRRVWRGEAWSSSTRRRILRRVRAGCRGWYPAARRDTHGVPHAELTHTARARDRVAAGGRARAERNRGRGDGLRIRAPRRAPVGGAGPRRAPRQRAGRPRLARARLVGDGPAPGIPAAAPGSGALAVSRLSLLPAGREQPDRGRRAIHVEDLRRQEARADRAEAAGAAGPGDAGNGAARMHVGRGRPAGGAAVRPGSLGGRRDPPAADAGHHLPMGGGGPGAGAPASAIPRDLSGLRALRALRPCHRLRAAGLRAPAGNRGRLRLAGDRGRSRRGGRSSSGNCRS
jgi:hypothetical protein